MQSATTVRQTATPHKPQDDGAKTVARLEKKWFEFDRALVLKQVTYAQASSAKTAADLEMVADEGVFEKPLCDELREAAQDLRSTARRLLRLRDAIVKAKEYPQS